MTEKQAPIEGREWRLAQFGSGTEVVEGTRITLVVADERVAGSAGCNRYMGSVTIEGASVEFGPLATTMMMCAPAIMDQERRFLSLMETVNGIRVSDAGMLELLDGDGVGVLVFVPADEEAGKA